MSGNEIFQNEIFQNYGEGKCALKLDAVIAAAQAVAGGGYRGFCNATLLFSREEAKEYHVDYVGVPAPYVVSYSWDELPEVEVNYGYGYSVAVRKRKTRPATIP